MQREDESRVLAPLDALLTKGLPSKQPRLRLISVDFADFETADFGELVHVLGGPALDVTQHEAWSFSIGGRRYVLPALALMRAVFRPQTKALPRLFQAQGLDAICGLVPGGVAFNYHLTSTNYLATLAAIVEPFTWMHSFLSARQMAGSVYQHALAGRISIQLPRAKARLSVRGVETDSAFWVTHVNLASVEALEEPLPHAEHLTTRDFSFVSKERLRSESSELGDETPQLEVGQSLPLRDGQSDVSDCEWEQLEATLRSRRRTRYDEREILDGILAKLCTGIPWRDVVYKAGTFSTASRQLASWRQTGKWDTVVRVISARTADLSDRAPHVPTRSGDAVAKSYARLSDEEWASLRRLGLSQHRNRKYDLRESVDFILQRELTGEPWNLERYEGASLNKAAYQLAYVWRKSGKLAQLLEALQRMRVHLRAAECL